MSGKKQRHVRCAIPGCLEKQRSLYNLPKDQSTRRNWLEFIFNYNVPDTFSPYMLVCCQHFESSCFANEAQYNAGFASKLLLLPGAIPTVDLRCPSEHKLSTSAPSQLPASRRVACQTDPVGGKSTATQLSQRTLRPHFRSIGTQTIPRIGPYLTSTSAKATRPARKPRIVVKEEEEEESSIEFPELQDSSYNPVLSGHSLSSSPRSL